MLGNKANINKKILGFLDLKKGWHYGSGGPPSESVVIRALEVEKILIKAGFEELNAFPGVDGEIIVCGYVYDHCFEITINNDLNINFNYEIGNIDLIHKEDVDFESLKDFNLNCFSIKDLCLWDSFNRYDIEENKNIPAKG